MDRRGLKYLLVIKFILLHPIWAFADDLITKITNSTTWNWTDNPVGTCKMQKGNVPVELLWHIHTHLSAHTEGFLIVFDSKFFVSDMTLEPKVWAAWLIQGPPGNPASGFADFYCGCHYFWWLCHKYWHWCQAFGTISIPNRCGKFSLIHKFLNNWQRQ